MRLVAMLALVWACGSDDKLSVTNAIPVARITSPSGGDEVREGAMSTVTGSVSDDTDEASTLRVIWYANGEEVCGPEAPMDDGTTACEIEIPAGDAVEVRLEVRDPKNALGQDTVRLLIDETDAPTVTLSEPLNEERFFAGEPIPFVATISDAEDALEDLTLWFMINGEDRLDFTATPTSDGEIAGTLTMSAGVHNVALWVEDTDGKSDQDAVTIEVVERVDTPPTVAILLPEADGTTEYFTGELIEMSAEASDADDAPEDLVALWESSIDGSLLVDAVVEASGAITSFSALSAGEHVLTLTVTDTAGQAASDSVVVQVAEVVDNPPTALILTPDISGVYYADMAVELSGTAADDEDAADALLAVWQSDVDGTLVAEAAIDTDGSMSEFAMLTEGLHVITLTVTDSAGQTDSDTAYINVSTDSTAPLCAITQPDDSTTVEAGDEVLFEGTATDLDVASTLLSVQLESDKDGVFATGTPSTDGAFAFAWDALSVDIHTITLTVTDDVGLTCTDFVVLTVSTYPVLAVDAPLDGAEFSVGDPVTFSATVSDAEDPAEDLTVDWHSDVDGTLSSGAPDSSGVSSFISSVLTSGTHVLTVTVTDLDGLYTSVVQVLTINGVPTAPEVEITPLEPGTLDDLLVSFVVVSVDSDGDPITYSYGWARDGVDTGLSATVVSHDETTRGETWTVTVTPTDGTSIGPAATASVTIVNTPPTTPEVHVSTVDVGCEDGWAEMPDGQRCAQVFDTLIEWAVAEGACNALDGHLVRVASAADGAFLTDLVVATVGPDIDYLIGFNDLAVEGSFEWSDGGMVTYTNWRDTEPNDAGGEDCTQVEAEALWNDVPCSSESLAYVCQTQKPSDDLYCEVVTDSTDADGDDVDYTVVWDVEGEAVTDTDTTTIEDDTVLSPELVYDETWTCTVTPSDDADAGESGSGSYTSVEPPAEYVADFGGTMIKIAAHTFEMGCTEGMVPDSGCSGLTTADAPHSVTLTRDFYMSETEVTQTEYAAVMDGDNPSGFTSCGGDCPVEQVSWYMAAAFTNAVSDLEGLEPCYSCTGVGSDTVCTEIGDPYACEGYRLPTEAEWEGAARCGEDLPFAGWSDFSDAGWGRPETIGSDTTYPVAEKLPNACGLYDMSGNVWEWVNDWHLRPYDGVPVTDPVGLSSGTMRIRRGGGWKYYASNCDVAERSQDAPDHQIDEIGFRIARTSP